MKERHWNSLVASLRYGDSVLVLGPEVPVKVASIEATDARGKSTSLIEALTLKLAAELEEENRRVTGKTLAAVAQQYEDTESFGPNSLRASAERFYKSQAYEPSDVHVALASLPFNLILTTGHDNLLEKALEASDKKPIIQRYHLRGDKHDNPEFVLPGSPNAPVIYHLFGDAQEPGSLVLSENDLLDFLIAIVSRRPPLPNSLIRALKRVGQNFLFIGFGIEQWYLRVLLKVLVRTLVELHRTDKVIATEPLRGLSEIDREQITLFYQRGTRIEIEDADISAFLADLAQKLEAEGGYAGQSAPLGPRPRVFISYAHGDGDDELAARVFDALQKVYFEPWMDKESLVGGDTWDQRIKDELEATDFTLVLYTPNFCRKIDSYVNKEVDLASDRGRNVRSESGPFLIPLLTTDIAAEDRVAELGKYQEMLLRPAFFDEDMAKVISHLRRAYQRRNLGK